MKSQPFVTTAVRKTVILTLGLLSMLAWTTRVGATVTALGADFGTGDAWRNTAVAKNPAYDPNGDKVYGTDGYYVENGGTSTLSSLPLPSYIRSVTVDSALYALGSNYGFSDPQTTGPSPTDMTGMWFNQSQPPGSYVNFFTITLDRAVTFVLTTIIDTHAGGVYPDGNTRVFTIPGMEISQNGGTPVTLTGLASTAIEGHANYAFFQLSGIAGDTFAVALQASGTIINDGSQPYGGVETSGLGFEQTVPEPSVIMLLGMGGLMVLWRRRQQRAT